MTDYDLRQQLLLAFEYSWQHEEWITPLDEILDDLTLEEVLWKPRADSTSIWEILLHLVVWHEDIVKRIRTGEKSHPEEGAWPPLPEIPDDAAWRAFYIRIWSSLEEVYDMLREVPISQIENSPYGLADLICRFTHNGYHLGQITKILEEKRGHASVDSQTTDSSSSLSTN